MSNEKNEFDIWVLRITIDDITTEHHVPDWEAEKIINSLAIPIWSLPDLETGKQALYRLVRKKAVFDLTGFKNKS